MSKGLAELKLNRVKGVLSTAMDLKDKALLLEKEIGLEPFYAMLAMGQSLASLASSMDLGLFELEYMLQRTPGHRKQYMNATANKLAKESSVTLTRFSKILYMDKGHAAAARHHAHMLEKSLRILNGSSNDKGTGNVIVNNQVVVRDKSEIPPLPDGLAEAIEGEYVDVKS